MSEISLVTPRGVNLAGNFVVPVDATDAAVLFSHSFFNNRESGKYFERLAAAYRKLGYATLKFDYSGHGESDDDIIVVDHQEEDLRASSGWLADQGFDRQLLHGHSFGTLAPLKARPAAVQSMILSGVITGPLSFDWEQIFSPSQLDELEQTGRTRIVDDSPSSRQYFEISKQTLQDLSLNRAADLVYDLSYPVLLLHDIDDEQAGLLEMTTDVFARLPDGSRVEAVRDANFGPGEKLPYLAGLCQEWARQHLPVRP
ncbi:alpha/beta hydrolase [Actinomyces sp. F1_1611]